ncbi:MAG: DNA repair protein RecO [Myxococcota bacterium]
MAGDRIQTDALVLRSADSGDDKVVHLLTPDLGHVPVFARAARKSRRRFGAHADTLNHAIVSLTVRSSRSLARLDAATARETFRVVKGDLARFALASTMAEVVLHAVPEHGHEPGVFVLLLRALHRLNDPSRDPSEDLLLLFELRILQLSGTLPDPDEIPGLPESGRAVLHAWLADRWAPLPDEARPRVARVLEALLEEATGRTLRSRPFLDSMIR